MSRIQNLTTFPKRAKFQAPSFLTGFILWGEIMLYTKFIFLKQKDVNPVVEKDWFLNQATALQNRIPTLRLGILFTQLQGQPCCWKRFILLLNKRSSKFNTSLLVGDILTQLQGQPCCWKRFILLFNKCSSKFNTSLLVGNILNQLQGQFISAMAWQTGGQSIKIIGR